MAVKRSIYLINPRFQLKFSLFVSSLVFIPSLLYPYTIYELINTLVRNTNSPEIIASLKTHQGQLIMLLVLWQLAFTAMVFVICIFQSHKIAGPMYKLKKHLDEIKNGKPAGNLFFRKGDNFQDIADDFNDAFGSVQEVHNKDFAYLGEVSNYMENLTSNISEDKKSVLNEIIQKLNEIKDRFKTK